MAGHSLSGFRSYQTCHQVGYEDMSLQQDSGENRLRVPQSNFMVQVYKEIHTPFADYKDQEWEQGSLDGTVDPSVQPATVQCIETGMQAWQMLDDSTCDTPGKSKNKPNIFSNSTVYSAHQPMSTTTDQNPQQTTHKELQLEAATGAAAATAAAGAQQQKQATELELLQGENLQLQQELLEMHQSLQQARATIGLLQHQAKGAQEALQQRSQYWEEEGAAKQERLDRAWSETGAAEARAAVAEAQIGALESKLADSQAHARCLEDVVKAAQAKVAAAEAHAAALQQSMSDAEQHAALLQEAAAAAEARAWAAEGRAKLLEAKATTLEARADALEERVAKQEKRTIALEDWLLAEETARCELAEQLKQLKVESEADKKALEAAEFIATAARCEVTWYMQEMTCLQQQIWGQQDARMLLHRELAVARGGMECKQLDVEEALKLATGAVQLAEEYHQAICSATNNQLAVPAVSKAAYMPAEDLSGCLRSSDAYSESSLL